MRDAGKRPSRGVPTFRLDVEKRTCHVARRRKHERTVNDLVYGDYAAVVRRNLQHETPLERRNELVAPEVERDVSLFRFEPAIVGRIIDLERFIRLPVEYPEYLALKKARHVYGSNPGSTVIGCDTGVFLDGEMIGKPKDEADAFEILKKLSGRTHKVITGCAVIGKNGEKSFSQITEVDFYTMSDDEILDYIKTGEPMDKAGAYGIQGFAARFIKEIRGDYFNVVGLPVSMLYRALRKNDHIKN